MPFRGLLAHFIYYFIITVGLWPTPYITEGETNDGHRCGRDMTNMADHHDLLLGDDRSPEHHVPVEVRIDVANSIDVEQRGEQVDGQRRRREPAVPDRIVPRVAARSHLVHRHRIDHDATVSESSGPRDSYGAAVR